MSGSIHLTPAQIAALAAIEAPEGVVLHQLADSAGGPLRDLYATPVHRRTGVRIAADGTISEIGETLPAE